MSYCRDYDRRSRSLHLNNRRNELANLTRYSIESAADFLRPGDLITNLPNHVGQCIVVLEVPDIGKLQVSLPFDYNPEGYSDVSNLRPDNQLIRAGQSLAPIEYTDGRDYTNIGTASVVLKGAGIEMLKSFRKKSP